MAFTKGDEVIITNNNSDKYKQVGIVSEVKIFVEFPNDAEGSLSRPVEFEEGELEIFEGSSKIQQE